MKTLRTAAIVMAVCVGVGKALAEISSQSPIHFTENKGQWDERVLFKAEESGGLTWFIERDGFTILHSIPDLSAEPIEDPRAANLPEPLRDREPKRYPRKGHALKFKFLTSNTFTGQNTPGWTTPVESPAFAESSVGMSPLSYFCNYFLGKDQSKWAPHCRNFERVALQEVWEGVDVEWYVKDSHIEFDFVVSPGGDPSQIQLRVDGLTGSGEVTAEGGEALLPTSIGTLRMAIPEAYQPSSDGSSPVEANFTLLGGAYLKVALPDGYDRGKKLVVDPLVYSSYLGESSSDYAYALCPDDSGGVVAAGGTDGDDFPTTEGPYDREYNGEHDVFVTRLNADGSGLIYSSYLGGESDDHAYALSPDGTGGVVVAGETHSSDFPTTEGAYDRELDGGHDVFVTRLNADGSGLIYSSYLGGSIIDNAYALCPDGSGGVVVAGETHSSDFPTTEDAYDREYNGGDSDVFVKRLTADGSGLIYSSYLGGVSSDLTFALCPDGSGGVIVAGGTHSWNFPTTEGADDREFSGNYDAFVTRLHADGSGLIYSSYLGGESDDWANALCPDGSGGVVVAGATESSDFPTTEGAYDHTFNGGDWDAFVTRLNADGSGLIYSSYLGGRSVDGVFALCPDGSGGVVVAGCTHSRDFPTTQGAYDREFNGNRDAFVTLLNADGIGLIYSSYLGGERYDWAYALCPDGSGGVVVAGETLSGDFPTTEGAYDREFNGRFSDAFVARIDTRELQSVGESGYVVDNFSLSPAYPNPFNGATTIEFSTGSATRPTRLAAYGLDGRLVADLTPHSKIPIPNSKFGRVVWDAIGVAPGVYLISLQTSTHSAVQKVVLMCTILAIC